MPPTEEAPVTPEEPTLPAATAEGVPRLGRRASFPAGMTVQEAMAQYLTRLDQLKQTRRDLDARAANARP